MISGFRRRPRTILFASVFVATVVAGILGPIGDVSIAAQEIDMNAAEAAEEFRWGVHAFHGGRFSDAAVAFNRTISFTPDDMRAREWLGRAYFRSGLVDEALSEWEVVVDSGLAGAYLPARVDMIRYRRGVLPLLEEELSLSRSQRVFGRRGDTVLFRRPGGIATEPGGDFFLVSLGTQEVLRISPNGLIRTRIRGGLDGIDTPFDVEWYDGRIYVSEFGRDRIAVFDENGGSITTIGESGLGDGRLLGPQYLDTDGDGFIYVTEWGSKRVSKFAQDGTFALSFGEESSFFPGLHRPTGIAIRGDEVFVADVDDEGAVLHRFDRSGNHLEEIPLPLDGDDRPEGGVTGTVVEDIGWYNSELLLVTAGRRVLLFNPDLQSVVSDITDEERRRVSSAAGDANRRVLVSDFDANDFSIFEPEGTLYAGLEVRIERILSRDFPEIGVLVSVHDRNERPIVGLESGNFIISEDGRPMNTARIDSSGTSVTVLDTVAVVQPRSGSRYVEDASRAVADLADALPQNGVFQLYAAGPEPVLIAERPASSTMFAENTARSLVEREQLFARDEVALDRSIRVAATQLLERGIKRNLVLIGDGRVGDTAFREFGLEEIGAFLQNNGIRFHLVLLEQRTPDPELSFLVDRTGGSMRYVYEPEGIAPLVDDFVPAPNGRYWITYSSQTNADFGRAYIEVSAEARLFVRSGRDVAGFFAPGDS
ncbi:MAG: hypothetical protein ACOC2V_01040 [Alkalispirochaeta sp.]